MSGKKDGGRVKRKNGKPALTPGEWAIMRAVWEHEPCAALLFCTSKILGAE